MTRDEKIAALSKAGSSYGGLQSKEQFCRYLLNALERAARDNLVIAAEERDVGADIDGTMRDLDALLERLAEDQHDD